jgi:NitT/TauT family transport system substrate-binding protein
MDFTFMLNCAAVVFEWVGRTGLVSRWRFGCAVLVILVAGSLPFTGAHAQTIVQIAAAQNSIGSLPIVIAEREGLFAAEGIKIEIINFKGGAPAVQALASGSVDACICATDHAISLRGRGQGGLVLAALTEYHGYGLVALASSPFTDLKSLRGKKIGITSAGSLTDNTLRFFLNEAGLNADRDVEIIGAGTGGAMRAAIESGSVAAGMLTTPDVQAAMASGKFKMIQDYRNLQYPALGLIVVERWVKSHDTVARGLARAVVRAEALLRSDPKVMDGALAEMYPNLSAELRIVLAEQAPHLLATGGRLAPAGYAQLQKMMAVADPTLKVVPYNEIAATAYLPAP